jgi:preprotein translocase subunit SecD
MMIRLNRFNTYLCVILALAMTCGCQTAESKRKKQVSTLEFHLEVRPDARESSERNIEAKILRDHPITITVQKAPFLSEAYIKEVKVIEVTGGFALRVQFDKHGTWLLEEFTAENLGKRIAVLSQFGDQLKETRWLAAPMTSHRIPDGVLTFTPDATREEAEQIALGLNNVAKKVQAD